ncbi:MAG: hypothetical protein EPO06_08705 [Burkholderiaceae bacterium]|nr:MAG: hypothetical protein EPO06_08705 [Burkholderiaceae bacterium]
MEKLKFWTTLDVVLHATQGVIKVPLKRAARLLGWEAGTMRNQKSEGKLKIDVVEENGRLFILAHTIAEHLDRLSTQPPTRKKGRPTNAERVARRAAGGVE